MALPHLSIEAVVIEANGLPPANTATATAMINATGLNRTCTAPASSASAWGSVLQMHVAYQSTVGIIEIELNDSEAPRAAENFRMLAHMGCYDGVTFHRVIDGFVLQGGDIECGREGADCPVGTGGHAAMFHGLCDGMANFTGCTDPAQQTLPEESSADLSHVPFALSMANAGMNTGGSQFFIVDNGSNPTHLDHTPGKDCRNASCHTIFGHVVGGMVHVDAISQVPTISPYSTPVDAVLILGFTALTMDSVEAEQPVDLAAAFTDLRLEQVLRQSNATIATMDFTLNNSGDWVGNVSYAATYGGQALTDVNGHLLVEASGIYTGGMEVDITDLEMGSNLCFIFTYADGLDPSGWDAWDRPSQTCLTLSDVGVDLAAAFTDLRLEQVLRQSNATIATMDFTLNNSGDWVGNVSYAATYGGQALTDVNGHLLVEASGIYTGGMEVDITDLEMGSNLCFIFTYADGLDPSGWDAWDRPSQTCLTLSDVGVDPGTDGTETDIGTPSEVVPGFGMGAALIGLGLAGLGRRSSRSENEII